MKALSVRLEDSLSNKFDRLCRELGYKKNTVISRLIQTFVQVQTHQPLSMQKETPNPQDPFLAVIGLADLKPLLPPSHDIDAFLYQL